MFTKDSTVKSLAEVPGMLEEILKITGTKVDGGMLAMGGGMSVVSAGGFVGWDDEKIEKILAFANTQ